MALSYSVSQADTILHRLNRLQWYVKIGDPVLATGIMSFALHELFYFGRCVPWAIIDNICKGVNCRQ